MGDTPVLRKAAGIVLDMHRYPVEAVGHLGRAAFHAVRRDPRAARTQLHKVLNTYLLSFRGVRSIIQSIRQQHAVNALANLVSVARDNRQRWLKTFKQTEEEIHQLKDILAQVTRERDGLKSELERALATTSKSSKNKAHMENEIQRVRDLLRESESIREDARQELDELAREFKQMMHAELRGAASRKSSTNRNRTT